MNRIPIGFPRSRSKPRSLRNGNWRCNARIIPKPETLARPRHTHPIGNPKPMPAFCLRPNRFAIGTSAVFPLPAGPGHERQRNGSYSVAEHSPDKTWVVLRCFRWSRSQLKLQPPNTKLQGKSKLQVSNLRSDSPKPPGQADDSARSERSDAGVLGIWFLELLWCLDVGAWRSHPTFLYRGEIAFQR